MNRVGTIQRNTLETKVSVTINLDQCDEVEINTGIGFFDHMLTLFARHGNFGLNVQCEGDLMVDTHHSIEDMGIALGVAFSHALGDKEGINRYGYTYSPMDEALSRICVDICNRIYLVYNVELTREFVGDFETEMLKEFFFAFVNNAKITLHIENLYGDNNHHIIESIFKGFGRCMKEAVAINPDIDGVLSTKGVL
jgi:imidazoleglycerol-phosphate dehydratase